MRPVATKLAKELRKAKRNAVTDLAALREAKELQQALEAVDGGVNGLPPNHAAWMHVFKVLAGLAHTLLGTHALRKLSERVEAADEEYMPGGPPMSPILDSVFMSWWMADVPVGPARESMCSILADIGPVMGLPSALSRYARVFAESRMGVYRLTELEPDRVELEELLTGARVSARLPPDLHGRGTLWLTRLLPPIVAGDADWVVWTTPYLLHGPGHEAQWLAYCERAVAGAASAERGEWLARHFKAADDPRRWTEYIMNGYAGENPAGSIVLLGIPDRPKTLPQHEDYDAVAAMDPDGKASPLERLRIRLHALAAEHEFVTHEPPPAPVSEPSFPEAHRLMALAYRTYGQIDREGRTAVDLLLADAASLPDEERRELAALAAGWFSAFEILHVRVDEGMELRDVFGGRKLWIDERSATRQIELGDLLVGWVMAHGERNTLEGALCHVPRMHADRFVAELRVHRDALARKHRTLSSKKRNGLLAPRIAPLLETIFAGAPAPQLVNNDGDEILLATATYDVVDAVRVRQALAARFGGADDGVYHVSAADVLVARLELSGRALRAECSSKQRLARTKQLLSELLGDAVKHRADAYQDPRVAIREAKTRRVALQPSSARSLPPEAQTQIQAMMLERMREWLDEPVPMLGGKTPRQAARSQRGRENVTHLLIRQQQIFESGPGLPPIDLGEIWTELGMSPRA